MKDPAYRAKCIEKAIGKHSNLDVMLDLADIAYDIFLLSLKNENKKITKQETQQKLKELNEWKNTTSKNSKKSQKKNQCSKSCKNS